VAAAAVALLLVATGCGDSDEEETAASSGGGESSLAEQFPDFASGDTLKVGAVVAPPWLLLDTKTNEFYGPAIELYEEIAKQFGKKLELVNSNFATNIAGLQANQFAIAGAPLFQTPERAEAVDFVTWSTGGTCYALLKSNTEINTLEDLNDPSVKAAFGTGTGPSTAFPKKYPEAEVYTVQISGGGLPIPEVLAGRATVTQVDNSLIHLYEEKYPELKFIPAGDECLNNPDLSLPIGLGIAKGNDELRTKLQEIADGMREDLDASLTKYSDPKYLEDH
jgi:ABC-type amino acid transport substrate-binding protein